MQPVALEGDVQAVVAQASEDAEAAAEENQAQAEHNEAEPSALVGAEPQPQPAQAQADLDPDVALAISMGLDPDFIANIPPEMRRELIQNEQFRAQNMGAPVPNRAPQREPEAMDVASIIATVQDPALRREMLQNLSQEQIDSLPSALRTEALNWRRGHLAAGGGLFGDVHGGRPPRHFGGMGGRPGGGELGRQMDLFMDRIRREAGLPVDEEPYKKALLDPKALAFDQLLVEYAAEVDRQIQDEDLQSEQALIKKIHCQLVEDTGDDQLLKSILTTICLGSNVKTDIVQFLRLILKQKSDSPGDAQPGQQGYHYRNKIINTLTFVMKTAARKDSRQLLALFEIDPPLGQTVVVSDFQWNKIFLTVTGVMRVLIDNNKKLILHMLKCLIQRDEYFVNRGDHLVSSHATLLEEEKDQARLRPPLAEIIQIMREQSEEHHKNSKKANATEAEKRLGKTLQVRVRNVKLLIQDVFKQFDLLFNEIALQ